MSSLAIGLYLLLCVPRGDGIVVEGLVLPDPGKGRQTLVGFGRYSVAESRRVSEIRLCVQDPSTPRQWMSVYADYNAAGEWHAKLALPADECICWVEMTTTDEPGDPRKARTGILTFTERVRIRVK